MYVVWEMPACMPPRYQHPQYYHANKQSFTKDQAMTFDPFVLPFFLGLIFLLIVLFVRYSRWIAALGSEQKASLLRGINYKNISYALGEVFMESLIHRRMYRRNRLLGYMHMSFAFGWFLLILIGNIESRVYSGRHINPPYYPIFLKFFVHDKRVLPFELTTVPGIFRFLMDFVLLMILSGLVLALFKRVRSNWFGLKKASSFKPLDKIAISALWLIFPLRLLAESFTAGVYHGGGFLTNTVGHGLAYFLPAQQLAYQAWWAYSIALGVFLIAMPWTRYMHIPTEVLLIFLRRFGLKTGDKLSSFSDVELNSCPRCGVCIDVCQMHSSAGEHNSMTVYFMRSVRERQPIDKIADTCLLCGRCLEACPVQINTNAIRIGQRINNTAVRQNFDYLKPSSPQKADVVYFAGCMGHLTPTVKNSMLAIFEKAGINAVMFDEGGTICCGRPLKIAGQLDASRELVASNEKLIAATGAGTLVTSCPICYKSFNEDYNTGIEVLHHSQYLERLVNTGKLNLKYIGHNIVYHDPCELGRGSGIYEEPRTLLKKIAIIQETSEEKENGLCCGGSIGDLGLSPSQRKAITNDAINLLITHETGQLVTACPLCKKTFAASGRIDVKDIAELVAESMK
jgi:Fe-S oxidoreductase